MTKFSVEHDLNYAAECVQIERLIELDNLDNLVGLPWRGYTALVPKSHKVGDQVVLFPAESQLSEALAFGQDLYSDKKRNLHTDVKGYLGNNRRVRAIRLRGCTSSALALPAYLFGDPEPGTVFDTVDGVEVCRKYTRPHKEPRAQAKKERAIDERVFPMHYDTRQFMRYPDEIPSGATVTVTQKLHGTSVRFGWAPIARKLKWYERLAQRLGVRVSGTEERFIVGSRRAIKGTNEDTNYYDTDLWSDTCGPLADAIPHNCVVYGEIIGWVGDSPIQKDYTYCIPKGEHMLYVYRVTFINDGVQYDLNWDAMEEFCQERGLKVVPLLYQGIRGQDAPEEVFDRWADRRFRDEGFAQALPLAAESPVDEGVVLRWDGGRTPTALKIKGPEFYEHETRMLDADAEDIEEEN